jgi:hypothetical protein
MKISITRAHRLAACALYAKSRSHNFLHIIQKQLAFSDVQLARQLLQAGANMYYNIRRKPPSRRPVLKKKKKTPCIVLCSYAECVLIHKKPAWLE